MASEDLSVDPLEADDLMVINCVVSMVPVAQQSRMNELFMTLDANNNNILEESDFTELAKENPEHKEKLMSLWGSICQPFDSDGDSRVSLKEFIVGLVNLALRRTVGGQVSITSYF